MIAQDLGRRRYAVREPRRTVRQGLWVALALGLPSMALLWHIAPILRLLRQDPALIAAAEPLRARRDVGLRAGALVRRAAQLHRRRSSGRAPPW